MFAGETPAAKPTGHENLAFPFSEEQLLAILRGAPLPNGKELES